MSLIQPSCLGTGYHIYMDNFYTSPKLFMDLANMKFGACGTYRESRKRCPRGRANALTKKCGRGSVRWIREGPLVFVKWMDTREVSLCSTIHPAFSGETVQRRVKDRDGRWAERDIPCPTLIVAYNKHMGGVDLSDQLIQYYSTHRKTARWYRTMLLHFLDIATTNAYILHREISSANQVQPMAHKDFMVELVSQLCGMDKAVKTTEDIIWRRHTDQLLLGSTASSVQPPPVVSAEPVEQDRPAQPTITQDVPCAVEPVSPGSISSDESHPELSPFPMLPSTPAPAGVNSPGGSAIRRYPQRERRLPKRLDL
ncbi:hypothetical protein SKAU_G00104110 [Synaphobranchus kaupii]|uniref:PiggyBac transposable element-derived protein domain-containing protein n=1 Tax=Synaphobranchus kaupii TaxID=118154 RepID=A0A9Q1J7R6_SYNKA|nr:hypothetical protein SKAU_G00104110 [Synaphobranchus kaupii]